MVQVNNGLINGFLGYNNYLDTYNHNTMKELNCINLYYQNEQKSFNTE